MSMPLVVLTDIKMFVLQYNKQHIIALEEVRLQSADDVAGKWGRCLCSLQMMLQVSETDVFASFTLFSYSIVFT